MASKRKPLSDKVKDEGTVEALGKQEGESTTEGRVEGKADSEGKLTTS